MQKYLIDETHFSNQNGAIIFYTGNEAPIEVFYSNSGFLTNVLPIKFSALVVFAEHR